MNRLASLVALAVVLAGPVAAQTAQPAPDGIARLLQQLEGAVQSGDESHYLALVAPGADRERAREFILGAMDPDITRVSLRDRDRGPMPGALPGEGYQVLVEGLIEKGPRGRIVTWGFEVRRGRAPIADEWVITDQLQITTVEGLHRLVLNPRKQYTAKGLRIAAEDFELRLADGSVFVAETEDGPTALVLFGRGEMMFDPKPPTERGQVKQFAGAEVLQTRFDVAFARMNPQEFDTRLNVSALTERAVDVRELRRAQAVFQEEIAKAFGLDLSDLSRDTWSLLPSFGDFVAEVRTRRFDTLTYARSGGEAEDVTLFDRQRHRNIAVYASETKLASRGRFYDEDALADYDVVDYDVEAAFAPERQWIDGTTRLKLRVRAWAVGTITLRLADSLVVRSVTSDEFGRLMHLRVRNQNSIVVNLPGTVPRDTIFSLTVVYAGHLPPQPIDREALMPAQRPRPAAEEEQSTLIPPEPSYLYSNRTFWYAQAGVSDYATATLRITVPAEYSCVASGEAASGSPAPLAGARDGAGARRLFVFVASQPVRYLACIISRFVRVDTASVSIGAPPSAGASAEGDPPRAARTGGSGADGGEQGKIKVGVTYSSLQLAVEANPRQQGRGRDLGPRARDIAQFYASLLNDCPYPTFTLALVENQLPGGHSPGYFATLSQPLPSTPFVWRNDPTSFTNYPEFFLAHELAHQWWGQAVGWKNYHEQWLSEGFAQYFAALYAEKYRGDAFGGMIRQFRRWALDESDQGPIYLGYRLGHIKGESRVFRALVYNKAAGVLHMLRRLIGDDAFFAGLRRFYATWRFQKAGTDDLRQAFEIESHRSLERFFERWIYGSDLPHLRFSHRTEGADLVLRFNQTGEVFDVPVLVTLEYTDGKRTDIVVPVTDRASEMRVPLSGTLRGVLVNRDEAAIAEIER